MNNEFANSIAKNLLFSILFGTLSFLFSIIRFTIPIGEGSASSLNEIPLLIGVIYISNPFFFIISSAISCLNNPPEGSAWATFFMHTGSLIPFWYYYNHFIKIKIKDFRLILLFFFVGAVLYYLVLLIPLFILTSYLFLQVNKTFEMFYYDLFFYSSFEITSTSIIATLYLQQYNTNQKLKNHIDTVEGKIKERTKQLDITIEELNSTNEELKTLNNQLDELVSSRTKELENRNIQLSGYAFINSHLLRAPLARILGLSHIIKDELKSVEEGILMEKFLQSCLELDKIVNLMAEVVTEESVLELNQIEDLQEQIRLISNEIQSKNSSTQ